MPGSSTLIQSSFSRPGTASTLTPNCGTAQLCSTSAAVVWMRTLVPTGTHEPVVGLEQAQLAGLEIALRDHVGVEGEVAVVRVRRSSSTTGGRSP